MRVRRGLWAGTIPSAGPIPGFSGGPFTFEVGNQGRSLSGLRFSRYSPFMRCFDGSSGSISDLQLPSRLWVEPSGAFAATEAIPFGNFNFTIRGRFRGATATGALRLIQRYDDQRGACDTGTIRFSVTPQS